MKLALLLVVVAACHATTDDYKIGPGGGGAIGGGGGGSKDAGTNDGAADDAGVPISGRVCVLKDLRDLTLCDTAINASLLTVSIGATRAAQPAKTGEFTIAAPLGAFTWHVTGRDFITTVMPLEAQVLIPVISDTLYTDLLGANSVVIQPELQSSIVMRVVSGVSAVVGVQATSDPVANNLAFFDDRDPLVWNNTATGATGANGMVWLPGIQMPSNPAIVKVTLTPATGVKAEADVVVEDQAITFVTKEL